MSFSLKIAKFKDFIISNYTKVKELVEMAWGFLQKKLRKIGSPILGFFEEDWWVGYKGFAVAVGIVVLLWIANFFFMPWAFPDEKGSTGAAGTAGDMFGGLTALFSGLAFAGLLATLLIQRKELGLQKDEMKQTREVFETQRFENTFFGLLKLLNDHVENIEVSSKVFTWGPGASEQTHNGRNALSYFSSQLPEQNEKKPIGDDGFGNPKSYRNTKANKKRLLEKYTSLYWRYLENDLGPYFRLIYNVLSHIENLNFGDEESEKLKNKIKYAKILRAHLSSSEVKLIMFNCASVHGEGMRKRIEKYALLQHIRRDDYEDYSELVEIYDPNAFQWEKRNRENPKK